MKYIDKVFKINADGDQYIAGHKIEISEVHIALIKLALNKNLKKLSDTEPEDLLQDQILELLREFEHLDVAASKGLRNVELGEDKNRYKGNFFLEK